VMYVIQQTAGHQTYSIIALRGATLATTEGIRGVTAATATPWTIRSRIPIRNMHLHSEIQSIALPAMRMTSIVKTITLAEKAVL